MLRRSRLLAVMRYEMRSHMTGRAALRMLAVAAALLLPASTIVVPKFSAPRAATTNQPPARIKVRGSIPAGLESRLELAEESPYELRGNDPVTLVATHLSRDMRAAMETLEGTPKVEVREFPISRNPPGRSLLIAILAISLLTGPLTDALPGERARRTLEVLLTTGISRSELIGGKWLAWTLSSVATAAIAAGLACWRGIQEPGWWLLGLPLFIASTVAFGLWLVRLVDDVVGGSAAPMRVIPVAAGGMAAIAFAVSTVSPAMAAAVPIGGAFLVAADLFTTWQQALAATLGSVVFVIAVLWRTGQDLDRLNTSSAPSRFGALGLSAVATLLWWLTVGGSGIWSGGGGQSSELATALPRATTVGAVALLACAVIAIARESSRGTAPTVVAPRSPAAFAFAAAVAIALAASGAIPHLDSATANPVMQTILTRLREGGVSTSMTTSVAAALAGLLSVFGQTVLFRAVVAPRSSWVLASVVWALVVCPFSPWSALAGSLALGALGAAYGWTAVLGAHLAWALGASVGLGIGGGAIPLQMLALGIALGAWKLASGAPTRHQL